MTTKKELVTIITNILKEHPEKEVVVTRYQNKLRNGRWGLHCYSLCYRYDKVMCRPWSGADCYWDARLDERLLKNDLLDITGRCMMLTH